MASDMVLIGAIFAFWLIMITGFGLVASDEAFQDIAVAGNTSFDFQEFNTSFEADSGDTTISVVAVQKTGFWGMLVRLFTFSIPSVTGMPVLIGVMVSGINYFLIMFILLLAYRQLRSGSG